MSINIEKDVLRYGVLAGIFYQVYQSLTSLAPDVPLNTLLINLALTATLLGLYFLAANDQRAPHCAFLVHIIALGGFTYSWANYGGLAGTVPGFYAFTCLLLCSPLTDFTGWQASAYCAVFLSCTSFTRDGWE